MARRKKKKGKGKKYTPRNSYTKSQPKAGDFNLQYHRSIVSNKSHARVNSLDPHDNFNQSLKPRCNNGRLKAKELMRVSQSLLFQSAIDKIGNTVARMPWSIVTPDKKSNDISTKTAANITRALNMPNGGDNCSYSMFVKSLVNNLLVFNAAPVQRQPGEPNHPFWLWDESPHEIFVNDKWDASISGIEPRYYYSKDGKSDVKQFIPLWHDNLFVIRAKVSSYEANPPSPVEVAYQHLQDWLGLGGYQRRITSKAVRDFFLSIDEEVDEEEMDRIKNWWIEDVQGNGDVPIFQGKVSAHKFGAKNDQELFMNFRDYVSGLIALSFGLHQKDFNVEQKSGDNRATASVTADQSFQHGILPIADIIAENINVQVVNFYFENFQFELSDREYRGEALEAQTAGQLFEAGLITRNEGRAKVGMDAIEGGDVFINSNSSPSDKNSFPTHESKPDNSSPQQKELQPNEVA